ncbi:hypothetical protein J3998_12295 [Thiomicrorhabdus sp. 6S2-11]|jgi:PBP1b-binding outer membrane lipoprotein LpoB|uniref:Lipoprotein n=1 Tax=Thiomicrorhabdus marina TaxID=2818442 RepID=A0ABS3Q7M0_9GAMM|nr:hypothetical protein [Thiomicrorhabdus marina]MBO1928355.1 hypothetical protein [Thiomicrorhabdus marina]
MQRTGFVILLAVFLVGCSQKPVPWVKTNAQKAYDMLGFEKDRGSSMTVPNYYQDSNHMQSKQAGKTLYLEELYGNKEQKNR